MLGGLAVSRMPGGICERLLEVKRAVKAFRAVIAHRRLTGLVVVVVVGLGCLVFLYFCRFLKWAKDLQ